MTPFAQLCLLLRCALGTEPEPARALEATRFDVQAVTTLAFRHRIAAFLGRLAADPALGPLLPLDLAACFGLAHEANGARNHVLRAELDEIVSLLNAREIVPLLLKGARHLIDDIYPDPAARFMRDLDLLVLPPATEAAAERLVAAGYTFSESGSRLAAEFHHLASLRREDSITEIELHRSVLSHWNARWLLNEEVVACAARRALAGGEVALPAPEHAMAHLILHGQMQHHRMAIGGVMLAEMLEAVLLARRFGADLPERVAVQARARGYGLACDTFLRTCELVTGETMRPAGGPLRPVIEGLARRGLWHQEYRLLQVPGRVFVWIAGWALLPLRYPSMLRRFPGRLAERGFYAARWREFRSIFLT